MRISDWSSDVCSSDLGVDVPHRAGAAVLGDVKGGRVEPFGHVARLVDAQEEEGHAPRSLPLQRGEPVADLLEGAAEGGGQAVDVVVADLSSPVERLVGHPEGGGEVVGHARKSVVWGKCV